MTIFEVKINSAMKNTGMTAAELSRITGLTPASISKYMSGKQFPHKKSLVKIAEAMCCPLEYFTNADIKPDIVTVDKAAELIGVTQQHVRIGLQRKLLPIGEAKSIKNGRYKYIIYSHLINNYIKKKHLTQF